MIQLSNQPRRVLYIFAVDRNQLVAFFNPASRSRPARIYPVRDQTAIVFHPPDPVIGSRKISFLFEVEARKHHGSHGQQKEKDRDKTSLALSIHGLHNRPRAPQGWPRRGGGGL